MNKLINEKSPYLLQHANNPVNWYPWNEEAFEIAKKEDKPIFLSVGYSTCHWCHNMAKESFENEEIAGILNKYFVSIKVDREERYDIDNLYMKFCQSMARNGGWPMSIFMTNEGKPFFAGTYFPRNDFRGITGFKTILLSLNKMWKNDKDKIIETSEEIFRFIEENYIDNYKEKKLNKESLQKAVLSMKKNYDNIYGGFSSKPKFPMAHTLSFLLEYYKKFGDENVKEMALNTLESIFKGGIYDHIAGGFSRYSVDEKWIIPHFEKMLYDNALLIEAFAKAYEITRNDLYKKIIIDTIEFLVRDMQDDKGAFYAGIDADSDGDEGKYYLWTEGELSLILGKENFERFKNFFNIEKSQQVNNKIVLNRVGKSVNIDDYKFLDLQIPILFEHREKRIKPKVDKKILFAWNCLIAKALIIAGEKIDEEKYIEMGIETLKFIEEEMIVNGRIMTSYIDGEVKYKGFIQDYSFFIDALINQYKVLKNESEKNKIFSKIEFYLNEMIRLFYDKKGGFFISGSDSEKLILKMKELTDGAIGSGNSVAAKCLIEISKMNEFKDKYGEQKTIEIAKKSLEISGEEIESFGLYYGEALRGLLKYYE